MRDAARAVAGSRGAGPTLDVIEHDRVSALVSGIPDGELRLRRENVVGHAGVLQAALEHGPILPLRLGTALSDRDAVVRDLLAPDAGRLLLRLELLEGKVEMQVTATYLEEPLLRSILAQDRALARAARRVQELPPAATHFERIRMGEAIAAAVQARRAADENGLLGMLRPLALGVSVSAPNHERAALNAAFLLERKHRDRFDAAVEELSRQRSSDTQFKLIGPLPPYSFADREWEATGFEEVSTAWA